MKPDELKPIIKGLEDKVSNEIISYCTSIQPVGEYSFLFIKIMLTPSLPFTYRLDTREIKKDEFTTEEIIEHIFLEFKSKLDATRSKYGF